MDAPLWNQLEDEPARWYARFELYLQLGPTRSLERVFQLVGGDAADGKRPGQAWYRAARDYKWAERAAAWDAAERVRLRAEDEDRRLDAREQRLQIIREMMVRVTAVLGTAELDALTREQALAILPQLRLFFRDLLHEERTELGLPTVQPGTGAAGPEWSHDDYAMAWEKMLEAAQIVHTFPLLPPQARELPYLALQNVLARLYADEASVRRVADQAGIGLARVRLGNGALDNWHAVLAEAQRVEAVEHIIQVAVDEYGMNQELRAAVEKYRRQAHESQAGAVAAEP